MPDQLLDFSISLLPNQKDFKNVNINVSVFRDIELDFILIMWFYNTKQSPEILNFEAEMLFEFQNAMNIGIIGV